jgi:hypothetical protein
MMCMFHFCWRSWMASKLAQEGVSSMAWVTLRRQTRRVLGTLLSLPVSLSSRSAGKGLGSPK